MLKASIIIPTYRRPRQLKSCLDSMTRLTFARDQFEVIVVDDGGNIDLGPVIKPFQEIITIRLIEQENTGPAGARNRGVEQACGEFIAFTDDDCLPDKDWLAVLVQNLQLDPSKMIGGHTVNLLEDNIYSAASQTLIDYLYNYYNEDSMRNQFFTSNNMAMARTMFKTLNGFDTSFPGASGEDRELCDRWIHSGHTMSYIAKARINHSHDLSFTTFLKQHFNYGTGALRFRRARAERGLKAQKIESPAFYFGLISYAWKNDRHRPYSLSILLSLSQIANAAGFVRAKFR